ncbi:hypothetical protein G6F46_002659 [Rhizopus delemar]|uniref:Uncharacterized protein n=3 Tax=Rhizopus TaxID=4842 RepID=I1CL53_RHIO9|nr:hypothetical protein RO3G_13894 [Rhizopus delemar RA 99-880]KAG1452988.1 hypothetical protein G6F55_008376 [Rhizopus delemar]KAG1538789.1 hypothetical protein G6F51_009544 [Rhizopus arrhizus]KAG1492903.1 hypothetical protein G6F54_008963 [Rhizopus delemar]KAG1507096.1 hypothetical protein G6F53_009208 [Rhizopus delemar]|eukprot:EIE89183.1 hypothetical protein RO3G_13894 [Rhizopus delemar RA 99-880]
MITTVSNHCTLLKTDNVRHKSFSSFVKSLLSIVSPSSIPTTKNDESEKQVRCLFEDMYFSFPAFEEEEQEEKQEGLSNCRPQPSLIVGTNRIMC